MWPIISFLMSCANIFSLDFALGYVFGFGRTWIFCMLDEDLGLNFFVYNETE